MRPALPTGTVTFLFTDVEGSTTLLEEIGDEAYDEAPDDHRRIVREACAELAGVEVDNQGDAFFFGSRPLQPRWRPLPRVRGPVERPGLGTFRLADGSSETRATASGNCSASAL
jgi:class 3 adenylate cyclase